MRFFDAVVAYEIALWAAVDDALVSRGLVRLGQLHALRVLGRFDGRARVQEVSTEIGITVGAASKLVDRLERDGLAERHPNPAHRRSSLVGLTADGRAALAAGEAVAAEMVASAVGDEDVQSVTVALERLRARLDVTAARRAA